MKLVILAALVSTLSAFADPKEYYYSRLEPQPMNEDLPALSFQQRLNPEDPKDTRTFTQRYYVDSSLASGPDAPVFFYLCGEATCEASSLSGSIRNHAQKFQGHLVALEHRYYGKSQPFDLLTTENLKYLSTDFALKDAASFQDYLTKKLKLTGKWIVVGGSYPGSLAAYYRLLYPKNVVGALASSGPVQARDNFEEYDRHVATVAGPECLANIKKVVAKVESVLGDPEQTLALKKKFQAEKLVEDLDFVYLIADMGALAVQYGYRDTFCKLLAGKDPVEGYATFTLQIYASWGIDALSMSAQGATSLDPASYESIFGMRQWYYQSCTEYGYWQNAYHDESLSARSRLINPDYHRRLCERLFGLKDPVDVSHINDGFYAKLLEKDSTRIYFTNGSTDPWMNLSIAKELGNDTNPDHAYETILGAAHCDDLRRPKPEDSEALKASRARFQTLVSDWLAL